MQQNLIKIDTWEFIKNVSAVAFGFFKMIVIDLGIWKILLPLFIFSIIFYYFKKRPIKK